MLRFVRSNATNNKSGETLGPVTICILLAAFLFVAARVEAGPAVPEPVPSPTPWGRVLEGGIYAKSGIKWRYYAPETSTGFSGRNLGPVNLVTPTLRIPATLGISFGMRYEIWNLPITPGKPTEFLISLSHPPMNVPGRGVSKGFSKVVKHQARNGIALGGYMYTFDEAWECLPGVWEIQVAVLGHTVIRQPFVVVVPPAEASK